MVGNGNGKALYSLRRKCVVRGDCAPFEVDDKAVLSSEVVGDSANVVFVAGVADDEAVVIGLGFFDALYEELGENIFRYMPFEEVDILPTELAVGDAVGNDLYVVHRIDGDAGVAFEEGAAETVLDGRHVGHGLAAMEVGDVPRELISRGVVLADEEGDVGKGVFLHSTSSKVAGAFLREPPVVARFPPFDVATFLRRARLMARSSERGSSPRSVKRGLPSSFFGAESMIASRR